MITVKWINARKHWARDHIERHFKAGALREVGHDEKRLHRIYASAAANIVRDPCHEWEAIHEAGRRNAIAHAPDGVLPSELRNAIFELRMEPDA